MLQVVHDETPKVKACSVGSAGATTKSAKQWHFFRCRDGLDGAQAEGMYSSKRALGTIALGPLTLAILGLACGPKVTAPAPGPVTPATIAASQGGAGAASQAELEEGRTAFVAKCNSCHGYPDLVAIKETEWKRIVDEMGSKADFDAKTKEKVLRFVLAARAERAAAVPAASTPAK
jgi:cytochrome c5